MWKKNLMRCLSIKVYFILYIFIFQFRSSFSYEKVYDVKDIKNIEFIAEFPEYDDVIPYREKPNCTDKLQVANPFLDWSNPASYQIKSLKKLYVAKLPNAFVSSYNLGTMFQGNQQLLFSISWLPHHPIFFLYKENYVPLAPSKHFKKLATVQGPHTFFYHNVVDRLPSIILLRDTIMKQDPEVKLLIPKVKNQFSDGQVPGYFYEYLQLLGITRDRIEHANDIYCHSADELYFATPFAMEPIPKKLLMKLRKDLVEASAKEPLSREYNHNLIVVIQREETNRCIENLDELLILLKKMFADKGYEILVYKADQSIAEQIQIFNHAKIVIGLMASGMTNIIFTNPGTAVVDIRPEVKPQGRNNHGLEWCWWLSSAVDLNYWFILHDFLFTDRWVKCPMDHMKNTLEKIRELQTNK